MCLKEKVPVVLLDELFVLGLDVRLVVLNLKRAGTTFAAESLASNVITQAATTMNPFFFWLHKLNKQTNEKNLKIYKIIFFNNINKNKTQSHIVKV